MNTNTNELAMILAKALWSAAQINPDANGSAMALSKVLETTETQVAQRVEAGLQAFSDDDLKAEVVRRGLDKLTNTQVLTQVAARGLAQVVLNEHITDEQVLDALDRRELTGDVLEAADDDDLWQAIDAKNYTVTENIGDLYENDLLDALDEDVKERMCRAWVEENTQEVREILLKRGEPDERDDEWVVGEVFRRGLAGDVLRDIADKMRLTY